MLRSKIIGILISANMIFLNIGTNVRNLGFENGRKSYRIERIGKFTPRLLESSGLEITESEKLITHQDSYNESNLYFFNKKGQVYDTTHFTQLKNIDWEDIAQDNVGNIYIGEFGNNANRRKDLRIFKFNGETTETIHFSFADQQKFPPVETKMNFDVEAMFWAENKLYLFSKNRGEKWVKAYAIANQPGNYIANPIDSIYLPHMITGADYHPEKGEFALLAYGMIYLFKWDGIGNTVFDRPLSARKFNRSGQSEGIVYLSENELLISNEWGKLFKMKKRKNRKLKP